MKRSISTLVTVGLTLGLAACSGTGDGGDDNTVTFRIWSDDAVAAAYEQSFAEFTAQNPDITVQINQVPWANYWDKLRADLSGGGGDDIFWVNAPNYASYADNGNLVNISELLPDAVSDWEPSAVEKYTRDGSLWGVPQLIDGGKVLYYNKKLVSDAEVDLADLTWDPSNEQADTFLQALKKLTVDSAGRTADQPGFDPGAVTQYGFNAAWDFDAIVGNFIASNGGLYQDSGKYVFADDPASVDAIEYAVDLINDDHVAPSSADTNDNLDFSRDQFLQGKLAVFESGAYNLANISEGADFEWGITPIPAGPSGRIPVTNSIIAAGNSASENSEATQKVLDWIGSEEGSEPLGANGALIPAVTGAQQSYFDFWASKGVDATLFPAGVQNGVLKNDPVPGAQAASADLDSAFKEIFSGRAGDIQEALKVAQDNANEQISG
ncbi:ABC transporter substrate-binding protein [Rhodococcus sp. 114MFTsu3.1]|uniref:ABC transporter substrate-binding protein n=1 Tax=Rhodococcus sp. 114MFTsu3.1 TaxID=1172184 RepID=UPI00037DE44C|nr:sugar ABC transporter substrate-binding protein [Rhodococcus sp. 114MFTsu3.1]